MAAGNTYTPIATTTVSGSSTSTITFSSIPATYTDLVLVANAGASSAADYDLQINSDVGSNYSFTRLSGDGTSAASDRFSSQAYIRLDKLSYMSTSISNVMIAHIQNYANSTTYKTVLARSNNAGVGTSAVVGLWRNTATINRLDVILSTITFLSGSTFTLYGIASA
jgi:hypothetical protein